MKKTILLSIAAACALYASEADIGVIEVNEKIDTQVIENVAGQEVKTADLAEALHKQVPSINMIRRSGIANDIVLRGQKRDNIAVTIDDAKVFGACPNRMDPPTSHVLTSNIERVEVNEGPFDVENFGTLSGSVKIETKAPKKGFGGEVYMNAGSFGYQKMGATVEGGSDKIKFMITGSQESGDQYKDGDGKTLAEQLEAAVGTASTSNYQDRYKDMPAFDKKTMMAKLFANISEKQDLELSYTMNRSTDVLYANSGMDAIYDDSDIMNLRYEIRDLASWSKKLELKAYNSKVDHPMSTEYRVKSDSSMAVGEDSNNRMISQLTTNMTGVKLINDTELHNGTLTTGLDTSVRNWDGEYTMYMNNVIKTMAPTPTGIKSINDVDTANNALFLKYAKEGEKLGIYLGARYNATTISSADTSISDKTFNSVDANIKATYATSKETKYFAALGQASRVPDARELYFRSSSNGLVGTPTLDQTTNTEIDLGVNKKYSKASVKAKMFYSMLSNYIYFNKDNASSNAFENVDATIYGLELSGAYELSEKMYMDFGMAYQVGQKDQALTGQTDKDLADIVPLKGSLALNYDHDTTTSAMIELVAASAWNNVDEANGEQAISGYGVVNLKAEKTFAKSFEVIVGIDNVFDKTYAVSNTYKDLTLLSDSTTADVMLLNEPGTYYYVNAKYKF